MNLFYLFMLENVATKDLIIFWNWDLKKLFNNFLENYLNSRQS